MILTPPNHRNVTMIYKIHTRIWNVSVAGFLFCLFLVACTQAAFADSYRLTVAQSGYQESLSSKECDEKQICSLPLTLKIEDSDTKNIIVYARARPGGIDFRFMWNEHKFSTSHYGSDVFPLITDEHNNGTATVDLYLPHPLTAQDSTDGLLHLLVQRGSDYKIGTVEIAISR